jgi:hypothetical protein
MLSLFFMIRSATVAAASVVFVASCSRSDPQPPWDTNQMFRELTSELRRSGGLTSDFNQSELLYEAELSCCCNAGDDDGCVAAAVAGGVGRS